MSHLNFLAVLAQADDGGGGGSDLYSSLILFGIIGFVFYFFMIRPQRRRVAEMRSLHSSLEAGDGVRTVGGLLGHIESIDDENVVLDMGGGTRLRIARQAIATKLTEDDA